MLAMTKYPRVLKKAQEEVDRVVGRNRVPTFADWDQLPHVNCCVKENSKTASRGNQWIPPQSHCRRRIQRLSPPQRQHRPPQHLVPPPPSPHSPFPAITTIPPRD